MPGHAFRPEVRATGFHLAIAAERQDSIPSPTLPRRPLPRPLPVHAIPGYLLFPCAEPSLAVQAPAGDDILCQSVLNDSKLEQRAQEFGCGLSLEAQFTDWLSAFATTRCRFIVADVVADKLYAEKVAEGNFSFLRTNAAYKRCTDIAYKR